jgi:ABC-type glycerol-3-phosphate transport system substrate-binding protein
LETVRVVRETVLPPVFGKGSQLTKQLSLAFALCAFILGAAHGEQFALSMSDLGLHADQISRDYSLSPYAIPLNGETVSGISLLELLPLMEEVYDLSISTADHQYRWTEDGLGDEWGETFYIPDSDSPALLFRGVLYHGVQELRFSGDRLAPEELEIWLSWEGQDELGIEIENFAGRHGIAVNSVAVPSPDTKLTAIVRARGPLPDLVMMQASGVEGLVEARGLQPLDYLEFPGLLRQGREAFTLGGNLWAMPFYFDTQVVFYNRDLIPSLPTDDWTLEAMEEVASRLASSPAHPLVWNAYSSNWLIPFQISFGKTSLLDGDGGITVDDQPTLQSLEYLLRLQDEGLLVPMERDAMDALFIAGRVGMMFSGSYAIPYLESLGLNFGVLPFPINQGTGRPVSALLDFKAFGMTRQTRHPILARRVLQYLYGVGVQLRFCSELDKLSVRRELDAMAVSNSIYGQILQQTADSGTVIPPDRVYGVYKNNMWKLIRFALSRQMSPQETLEAGQLLMDADR